MFYMAMYLILYLQLRPYEGTKGHLITVTDPFEVDFIPDPGPGIDNLMQIIYANFMQIDANSIVLAL